MHLPTPQFLNGFLPCVALYFMPHFVSKALIASQFCQYMATSTSSMMIGLGLYLFLFLIGYTLLSDNA